MPDLARTATKLRNWVLAAAAVSVVGCQSAQLPDPNDPATAGIMQPEVLRNNLKGAADAFYRRVRTGEITDAEAQRLLQDYANKVIQTVPLEKVPADKAWEYGEVFITARRWREARQFLEVAVKNAPNEDRRVNDSLRLARALVNLNDVPGAIKLAESTFSAPPRDKAPILPAILYEIVKEGEGKGQDVALANLLREAVKQHEETIVDPETEPGRMFNAARGHHIRTAYVTAMRLYDRARRSADAQATARELEAYERRASGTSGV